MNGSKPYTTFEGIPVDSGNSKVFRQYIEKSGKTLATVSGEEKSLVEIIAKAAAAALNKAVGN